MFGSHYRIGGKKMKKPEQQANLVQLEGHESEGFEMRKGVTRKPQADEPATSVKNYIARSGLERLKDETAFCSPGNARL
jgi:hypothetical protein